MSWFHQISRLWNDALGLNLPVSNAWLWLCDQQLYLENSGSEVLLWSSIKLSVLSPSKHNLIPYLPVWVLYLSSLFWCISVILFCDCPVPPINCKFLGNRGVALLMFVPFQKYMHSTHAVNFHWLNKEEKTFILRVFAVLWWKKNI